MDGTESSSAQKDLRLPKKLVGHKKPNDCRARGAPTKRGPFRHTFQVAMAEASPKPAARDTPTQRIRRAGAGRPEPEMQPLQFEWLQAIWSQFANLGLPGGDARVPAADMQWKRTGDRQALGSASRSASANALPTHSMGNGRRRPAGGHGRIVGATNASRGVASIALMSEEEKEQCRRRVLRAVPGQKVALGRRAPNQPPPYQPTTAREAAASEAAAFAAVAASRQQPRQLWRGGAAKSAASGVDTRSLHADKSIDPFWHVGRTSERPRFQVRATVEQSELLRQSTLSSPFLRQLTSAEASSSEATASHSPPSARRSGRTPRSGGGVISRTGNTSGRGGSGSVRTPRTKPGTSSAGARTPRSDPKAEGTNSRAASAPSSSSRSAAATVPSAGASAIGPAATTLCALAVRNGRPAAGSSFGKDRTAFKAAAAAEVLRRVKDIQEREKHSRAAQSNSASPQKLASQSGKLPAKSFKPREAVVV